MWWYDVMIRYDDTMWWYDVMIRCDDTIWWYDVMIRCDDTMWWYDVMIRCDDTMWWYDVMIRYDDTMWWYDVMIRCDDTMWWYNDESNDALDVEFMVQLYYLMKIFRTQVGWLSIKATSFSNGFIRCFNVQFQQYLITKSLVGSIISDKMFQPTTTGDKKIHPIMLQHYLVSNI